MEKIEFPQKMFTERAMIFKLKKNEIRAQFHQCSTYSFYARRSQKRKKIPMAYLYFIMLLESMSLKVVRKMLMKLTPEA